MTARTRRDAPRRRPVAARRARPDGFTRFRHRLDPLIARLFPHAALAQLTHAAGLLGTLRTLHHHVPVPTWPASLRPLRVAFASDFHAGPCTHPSMLAAACDAITTAQPDVVIYGGDFVSYTLAGLDGLVDQLARVPARMGRYAVLGNHDVMVDADAVARRLERAGIRVLLNESVKLPAPFSHVSLCGMDDPWLGAPDVESMLRDAQGVRLVAMHAPSGLLHLGEHRFSLALCGHTHGGQVALPGGIAIAAPGPLSRQYNHGRFDVDGRTLIVSRGVGTGELPLRLWADPDVLVCALGG